MTSLKERLAALKAKAAAPTPPTMEDALAAGDAIIAAEKAVSPLATEPEPAPAPTAPSKPLSFAEKMALRKKEVEAAQAAPPKKEEKPALEIDPATIPEDPEDAQAYVDIKQRIHNLEDLFDDDLQNAMSELKAALKKNPNAVSLMLYSDVGKMVTALRRMAGIQLEAKTTGKKPGRKKTEVKAVDFSKLTPEQIADAIDF